MTHASTLDVNTTLLATVLPILRAQVRSHGLQIIGARMDWVG
jgi:hypothetical protein